MGRPPVQDFRTKPIKMVHLSCSVHNTLGFFFVLVSDQRPVVTCLFLDVQINKQQRKVLCVSLEKKIKNIYKYTAFCVTNVKVILIYIF